MTRTRISISLTGLLARRWLVSRTTLRAAALLVAAFAVLAAVFACTSAFSLTAQQQADADFGVFQRRTYDTVRVGDLSRNFLLRADRTLTADAPGSQVSIETTQVRPDSFTKTYVQSPLATVRFVESPQLRAGFPGRYSLDEGTWPDRPGDVLVSRHVYDALPDHDRFTALSGRARLHVVGVVTDAYAEDGDVIVAAGGTWESIPEAAPGRAYQPVEAQVNVLFARDTSLADVRGALVKVLPPLPQGEGTRADTIDANYSTRNQSVGAPVTGFGADDDLVVSFVPLLLIVLLVSVLVVAQTRGLIRADSDRLQAIGIDERGSRRARFTTMIVLAGVSIVIGLATGWLATVALRALVLPRYADHPLSPLTGIDSRAWTIAAASFASIVLGAIAPRRGAAALRAPVMRLVRAVDVRTVRRVVLVLLLITATRVGSDKSIVSSYLVVVAVLLATPDLLRIFVWLLPTRGLRSLVARRIMQSDPGRQAAAALVVAACIAVPVCAATQLVSEKASESSLTYNLVPANQIWVQNTGDTGDLGSVAGVVSRVAGLGRPVVVRGLTGQPGEHGEAGPSGRFTGVPVSGSYGTDPMVVSSASQLRQVIGSSLPPGADAVLDAGGVVVFTPGTGPQRIAVYPGGGGAPDSATPPLPTVYVSVDRQFTSQFAGAILLRTARALSLPVSKPKRYVYTGVRSAATIRAAVAAAVDAGFDSEFVQYDVAPPPPDLPTAAYVFLAGLVVGGFAVLLLVLNAQAGRLRAYSARLVSLGLTPRWTVSVLGLQAAVVVAVGLVLGVLGGVLGVMIAANHYPVVDIPTGPIVVACVATVAAAALATVLAVRTLRATENPVLG